MPGNPGSRPGLRLKISQPSSQGDPLPARMTHSRSIPENHNTRQAPRTRKRTRHLHAPSARELDPRGELKSATERTAWQIDIPSDHQGLESRKTRAAAPPVITRGLWLTRSRRRLIGAQLEQEHKCAANHRQSCTSARGFRLPRQGQRPVAQEWSRPAPAAPPTQANHSHRDPGHPAICAARTLDGLRPMANSRCGATV